MITRDALHRVWVWARRRPSKRRVMVVGLASGVVCLGVGLAIAVKLRVFEPEQSLEQAVAEHLEASGLTHYPKIDDVNVTSQQCQNGGATQVCTVQFDAVSVTPFEAFLSTGYAHMELLPLNKRWVGLVKLDVATLPFLGNKTRDRVIQDDLARVRAERDGKLPPQEIAVESAAH